MADYHRITLYFTEPERKKLFRAHKYGKHAFLAKTPGEFCKFAVMEKAGGWVRPPGSRDEEKRPTRRRAKGPS